MITVTKSSGLEWIELLIVMVLQIMCWNNHIILKLQKNVLFHVIIYILWLQENILVI